MFVPRFSCTCSSECSVLCRFEKEKEKKKTQNNIKQNKKAFLWGRGKQDNTNWCLVCVCYFRHGRENRSAVAQGRGMLLHEMLFTEACISLFHFPVGQTEQSSGWENSLYYLRFLFVLLDKSKTFSFILFQQEKDYRSGSLSSYASLWSVSTFTIFSSTCDLNTRPPLLLGYVSKRWQEQGKNVSCNAGNKCAVFYSLIVTRKGKKWHACDWLSDSETETICKSWRWLLLFASTFLSLPRMCRSI